MKKKIQLALSRALSGISVFRETWRWEKRLKKEMPLTQRERQGEVKALYAVISKSANT